MMFMVSSSHFTKQSTLSQKPWCQCVALDLFILGVHIKRGMRFAGVAMERCTADGAHGAAHGTTQWAHGRWGCCLWW